MKTSEEFILEIKQKSGNQMTRDGKRIADIDDRELMKRMIERYPGERENIIDVDEYLGEEAGALPDVPAKSAVQERLDAVSKSPSFLSRIGNRIKETAGDVVETVQGVGGSIADSAKDIYGIATNDDTNLAQKFAATSGRAASGAAGIIGELTIGAGKTLLPQDGEDMVKSLSEKVATAVSETEAAKGAAEWYQNLSPDNKVIVDSLGGIASLVTEVIGLKGGSVAGKVLKEGIEESAQTVAPGVVKVAGEVADTVKLGDAVDTVVDVFTPSQRSLEAKVNQYFEKGVKPNLGTQTTPAGQRKYQNDVVTGAKVITNNKDNLKFFNENGEVVAGQKPETLQQLADSIEQTKKTIYSQYDDLATKAGDAGVKVDMVRVSNQLDDVINNKVLAATRPEAVEFAKGLKNRLARLGEVDAKTAQEIIQQYNLENKAFWRQPTPDGLSKNAITESIANIVRKDLDEGIEGLTGANYQKLKNQYGALKTIERDVMRATLRDARKNVKGLIDYTDILSGGQLVSGLLTLNPGMIASGAAQKSIASYFKFLNNPNRAVKKMFDTAEKLDQDPTTIPMSTRKQIEGKKEGDVDSANYVPIRLGKETQSSVDLRESQNPEIKTFGKNYFTKGVIPVEKIDSDGNISIEYGGNIYYPDPEDLPTIKFGNKPKSKKEKTDIDIENLVSESTKQDKPSFNQGTIPEITPKVENKATFSQRLTEGFKMMDSEAIQNDARKMNYEDFVKKYEAYNLDRGGMSTGDKPAHAVVTKYDLEPTEMGDTWDEWAKGFSDKPTKEKGMKEVQKYNSESYAPVLVEEVDGKYMVVDGHHRVWNLINDGVGDIPVYFDRRTLQKIWERATGKKISREDGNAIYNKLFPKIQTLNLKDKNIVDADGDPIADIAKKIQKGAVSYSKGPIEAISTNDGSIVVLDGQHRVNDALKAGKTNIDVTYLTPEEALSKYGFQDPT